MNDIISVVVPIYNVKKYLEICLHSLVNQTYKNLEIILVDDGSTDGSSAICDIWAKKDNRIKVIHKTHGGVSDARNKGLDIAKGDFIGFVDSDDKIKLNMYEILYKNMKIHNADISVCNFIFVHNNDTFDYGKSKNTSIKKGTEAFNMLFKKNNYGNFVWNKLYKHELFNKIRFPYGKNYEDIYVMHKLYYNAKTIVFIDKGLYYYISRKTSILEEESVSTTIDFFDGMILRAKFPPSKRNIKYLSISMLNKILKSQKILLNKNVNKNMQDELKKKCNYCLENFCTSKYLNKKQMYKVFLCKKFPCFYSWIYKIRTKIRNSNNRLAKFVFKIYIKNQLK